MQSMNVVQLIHHVMQRFGIIIAIALLVIWAVGTYFEAPGGIHLLLTIGVSMLIWRIVVSGDRAHPQPKSKVPADN
jgi:hypothetical protein